MDSGVGCVAVAHLMRDPDTCAGVEMVYLFLPDTQYRRGWHASAQMAFVDDSVVVFSAQSLRLLLDRQEVCLGEDAVCEEMGPRHWLRRGPRCLFRGLDCVRVHA